MQRLPDTHSVAAPLFVAEDLHTLIDGQCCGTEREHEQVKRHHRVILRLPVLALDLSGRFAGGCGRGFPGAAG
jgi:hypothetical protein